ncbi:MAG: HAMP domain-containing sensor histidine kinase [Rubrivivax sp.]|nr:HAMP domain-containing sensor histidine kinase [Rubrivivax sp.]
MTVRLRLALTIFLTGLVTAVGVIATVAIAFQRFEHESTWQRADAFLARVTVLHDDLLDEHQRNPQEFGAFLRNLVLYEPGSQLYLLDARGTVLASTGRMQLPPGFQVKLGPVQEAVAAAASGDRRRAAYVMGDDPEYMNADAVIAARALRRAVIRPDGQAAAGWLYLVCRKEGLPAQRLQMFGSTLAGPALSAVAALMLLATALAAWIIVAVTRPLRVLSDEVDAVARLGFKAAAAGPLAGAPEARADDEFGRLRHGFQTLLARLRQQWDELHRLDHFRRESVSNLSHDLRSPLTATVACLETLERRWGVDAARDDDRRLVAVALRNTRNAAGLVRSLGDLALLDEPEFKLRPARLELGEVLDDIRLRFAERFAKVGLALRFEQQGSEPLVADVDVELFERALANLLDNALKFTAASAPGGAIVLAAGRHGDRVRVSVSDPGPGIPAPDQPHLFDRHYQSRDNVAPASSEQGKGLGLAIVKRIVELHRGTVAVQSEPGRGTTVTIELPVG